MSLGFFEIYPVVEAIWKSPMNVDKNVHDTSKHI